MISQEDQIRVTASRAGLAAYSIAIRRGADVVAAQQAYNRAYSRSVPPCWANLVRPPSRVRGNELKRFNE